MSKLPKEYSTSKGIFTHIFCISLFVFGMLLLFSPTSFDRFSITFSRYSFHVTMVFCIVLVVLLLSRTMFWGLHRDKKEIPLANCFMFSAAEILFSSGFTALYLWLVSGKAEAFFWFFGLSMVYLLVLMFVPYIVVNLYFILLAKNEQILHSNEVSKEKIRFMDERDNLKLLVANEAVLYIQSEENYLKICYLEQNEIKFCTIRSSMKRIEELCERNGLVRCHRSYFINKTHVQSLQKDKEFTYAVLDVPAASRVPVSKNYYDQISSLL
ncbi:MAG: LytTR family transcriptional regulator [Bacteroidales bacterium]|nr:LytTR family transcriptional regulator [Bacteroidales bacterium]